MCGVASGGNRVTADRLGQLCNVERMRHTLGEFGDGMGMHLEGPEKLCNWLKRRLAEKGGIRRERSAAYLGENVWHCNHRAYPVGNPSSNPCNCYSIRGNSVASAELCTSCNRIMN